MAHINDSSTPPATDDSAELERAQREDALGKKVLEAAGRRGPMVMSTPESIRQGNEAMARAEQNAVATTAARIANLELISLGALQRARGVKALAISRAVAAKRIFAIVGPSGENYYPAYYADETLYQRTLDKVLEGTWFASCAVEALLLHFEVDNATRHTTGCAAQGPGDRSTGCGCRLRRTLIATEPKN